MTSPLADVAERVAGGQRLRYEDGVTLYESNDIHTIGRLADQIRRRLHGTKAYYNVNRHINYTNYCVLRCKFCSFYRPYPTGAAAGGREGQAPFFGGGKPGGEKRPGQEGQAPFFAEGKPGGEKRCQSLGYELSVEQVVARAKEACDHGATEVHIVGGLHPKLPFEYYLDMCRGIKAACPDIHIKAFTAIEIIHFTRISKPRLTIRHVLEQLREAGLGSLPGGGAEIFDDRVHAEAFKNKVGEQGWFDVHRTAHELGIYTNATMLYGHVETPAERIKHLIKLREHQGESLASRKASFNCVIPLSFIPEGSAWSDRPGPTGLTDLKTLAISRLMADNVPHIKAFWIMQSAKLAQVSLSFGVDDLDGTVVYYDITKGQGEAGSTHQELTVNQLCRMIRQAGFEPVERDTLYRPVIRENGLRRSETQAG